MKNNKYKIIISNKNLYREVELPSDAISFKVGTTQDCDVRLDKDLFFDDVRLDFVNSNDDWTVMCSDKVFLTTGDTRRLITAALNHGDTFFVKYQESSNDVFALEYMVDFDSTSRSFEREISIAGANVIKIGSAADNNIVVNSEYVTGDAIELVKQSDGYAVRVKSSTYGFYKNGVKTSGAEVLKNRDFFSISDFLFYLKDESIWTEASNRVKVNNLKFVDQRTKNNYPLFTRNTRVKYEVPTDSIGLLVPPQKPTEPTQNLAMTLMPALGMLALTVVVRGFMSNSSNKSFILFSVCSMSMGIITSVVTYFSSKKKYKTDCEDRIVKYQDYIEKKKVEIADSRIQERRILQNTYRDTNQDIESINDFNINLFDRLPGDDDFLKLYLGRGAIKANREIDYKKQETLEPGDELSVLPDEIKRENEMIPDCPITVDLKECSAVGILGTKVTNNDFLKVLMVDTISRHYFGEVKVYLLVDEIKKYIWAKKIPHISEPNGMRNIVYNTESRNNVFESLYRELTDRSARKTCEDLPYLVIYVMDDWGIRNHPVSQFIENAKNLKVCFIFFGEKRKEIPLYCDTVIELTDANNGIYVDAHNGENTTKFTHTNISDEVMLHVCSMLEPVYCEEISLESSLRKSISLFELLNIYSVDDIDLLNNWNNSRVWETMAAPIGVNSKNDLIDLNLHEKFHGPHGLVAGTTGSGKSEILQTYILSAAILFHPYEVSFVIIDFKGGGMVDQFQDLPHLIGAITNIDGREIDRSLKSIKAELLKRQTLFREAKVNHIDKYIKLYKSGQVTTPLPHLIIIVDEFAELKADQPEFMKELISAARIGRSLGVHLILATQKPAGQVNEQIWSNSKFKLCLKVQTKEDSNEVLKSPLAAEIKEPGRAYLQVGNNEMFELLQSGFSGASEKDSTTGEHTYSIAEVDYSGRRKIVFEKKKKKNTDGSRTQLEAIVDYVNTYCKNANIQRLPNICLPPLSDNIFIEDDMKGDKESGVSIGIYDDPDSQFQGKARINLANENYMIIGSSSTGKTNLLQVLIRQIASIYTPKEANIYIMDFGAMYLKNFDSLCYVGGVVTASEEEKLKNLFKLLIEQIAYRKEEFLKLGISSYSAYEEGGFTDIPRIFVFLDNFAAFKELYMDSFEEEFLFLIREGISCGINMILANSATSGLGYKYMSNFAGKIALQCNDTSEYSTLFERCRMQPKEVAGRALFVKDKAYYEVQTYLAFEGEKEIDRSNAVKEFIAEINAQYPGVQARRIPEIPETLTIDYIQNNYTIKRSHYSYPVALDYANVDVVNLDFALFNELCIIGNENAKRINVVKSILAVMESYIFDDNFNLYVIDNINRELKYLSDKVYVEKYTPDYNSLDEIITKLEAICQARYDALMQEEQITGSSPLQVVVINNRDAIDYICSNKPILESYNKITKQFKNMGVCFLFTDLEDASVPYGAPEIMKRLKENKKALITTTKLKEVKFCDVPSGSIRSMKPLEVTDAYLLNGSDIQRIKMTEGE